MRLALVALDEDPLVLKEDEEGGRSEAGGLGGLGAKRLATIAGDASWCPAIEAG